jgi:hypothetical protein
VIYTNAKPSGEALAKQLLAHCEARCFKAADHLWSAMLASVGRAEAWDRLVTEIAHTRQISQGEAVTLARRAVEDSAKFAPMA